VLPFKLRSLSCVTQNVILNAAKGPREFLRFGIDVATDPVSSEISDLQNFLLHVMCTCTEWYSTNQIGSENWWL